MTELPTADDVVLPALLRAARGTYSLAIRERLADGGFADMPRNGPYVLGGMANHGGAAADLIRALGVSKQAASQLVDTLVERNYLRREPDDADRRRVVLELTGRGQEAAAAVRAGVLEVGEELARRCPPEVLTGLRAGLVALIDIREEREDAARADAD